MWKGQILAAIIASGFDEFIFGSTEQPSQFLDDDGLVVNPDFRQWQRTDKAVISLLFASLSPEPLSQVVSCRNSREVWDVLRNRYESASPSRILNLRLQMQQLRKDGRTMQQYLNALKSLSEQLSAIGEPVRYRDYLWYSMEGLPAEYVAVVTAIYSRTDQPKLEEVHNLLLNFDMRLERRYVSDGTLPQVNHSSLHSPSVRPHESYPTSTYPAPPHTKPVSLPRPPSRPHWQPPRPFSPSSSQTGLLGKPPVRSYDSTPQWGATNPPYNCSLLSSTFLSQYCTLSTFWFSCNHLYP
ncbi:hypothetical protein MLD38_029289 [Melastoma candidum]|uniref:Uncharacterized protein n=1 Tax=Melastoma candidum TaxID=119954 RepID=A0ACB9N3I0_9MYRT|nr:hypothetical protein MLD38_029289 [Melastoma candidum]